MSIRYCIFLLSFATCTAIANDDPIYNYYFDNPDIAKTTKQECNEKMEALLKKEQIEKAIEVGESSKCKIANRALRDLANAARKQKQAEQSRKSTQLLAKYKSLSVKERLQSNKTLAPSLGIDCSNVLECQMSFTSLKSGYGKYIQEQINSDRFDVDYYYTACYEAHNQVEVSPFSSLHQEKSECDFARELRLNKEVDRITGLDFFERLASYRNCNSNSTYDVCKDANKKANKQLSKASAYSKEETKAFKQQCLGLLKESKKSSKEEI